MRLVMNDDIDKKRSLVGDWTRSNNEKSSVPVVVLLYQINFVHLSNQRRFAPSIHMAHSLVRVADKMYGNEMTYTDTQCNLTADEDSMMTRAQSADIALWWLGLM